MVSDITLNPKYMDLDPSSHLLHILVSSRASLHYLVQGIHPASLKEHTAVYILGQPSLALG